METHPLDEPIVQQKHAIEKPSQHAVLSTQKERKKIARVLAIQAGVIVLLLTILRPSFVLIHTTDPLRVPPISLQRIVITVLCASAATLLIYRTR